MEKPLTNCISTKPNPTLFLYKSASKSQKTQLHSGNLNRGLIYILSKKQAPTLLLWTWHTEADAINQQQSQDRLSDPAQTR